MGHGPSHQYFLPVWLIPFKISFFFIKLTIYQGEWSFRTPKKISKNGQKISMTRVVTHCSSDSPFFFWLDFTLVKSALMEEILENSNFKIYLALDFNFYFLISNDRIEIIRYKAFVTKTFWTLVPNTASQSQLGRSTFKF